MDAGDYISIWAAVVSTLLAIDKLMQWFKRVDLRAFWEPETDRLWSEVTNVSRRPLTITQVDLAYGVNPQTASALVVLSGSDVQLLDGQLSRFHLSRRDVIQARVDARVDLSPKGLLWLRVRLAGFGHTASTVTIDPAAICEDVCNVEKPSARAAPYIAAALFLGYPATEVTHLNREWFGEVLTK